MNRSALTFSAFTMTCATLVAFPAAASASSDGMRHAAYARHVVHRHAIPASAEALSPSLVGPSRRFDDDSDGLTRNINECNLGCIDN